MKMYDKRITVAQDHPLHLAFKCPLFICWIDKRQRLQNLKTTGSDMYRAMHYIVIYILSILIVALVRVVDDGPPSESEACS